MSSRVFTGPGILQGQQSPKQRGIAPVSLRATLAKPKSCNFKLPRLPWLMLDKQHRLGATTPSRLFPSPLQVTHLPKPLTHCQKSCCCPRAELSVPRNNRAISELPSAPAMLPHSSPPCPRDRAQISEDCREGGATVQEKTTPSPIGRAAEGRWLH